MFRSRRSILAAVAVAAIMLALPTISLAGRVAFGLYVGTQWYEGYFEDPPHTCDNPQPGDNVVTVPPGGTGTVCNPGPNDGHLYIRVPGSPDTPVPGSGTIPPGKGVSIENNSNVSITLIIK